LGAACVQLPEPEARRAATEDSRAFAAQAAEQVRHCYRTPPIARAGREIATRLRVRYAPDGSLIGLPIVVSQSGVTATNQAYASPMAEAARLAVIRCAPIHVPAAFAQYPWNEFDLLFSPQTMI
jgi:hypothetical protein